MTPDRIALKVATAAMIKGVGGFEAAAGYCRIGKTQLQVQADHRNPANASQFVAVDVIADLEPLARERDGWPHVTRALATALGFALVELPTAAPGPDDGDWHDRIGALADHGASITRGLCKALKGDRRVTPREIREFDLIGQCDDLIADVVKLRAMLEMVEDQ